MPLPLPPEPARLFSGFEVVNVTSLTDKLEFVAERGPVLIQEHAVPVRRHPILEATLRGLERRSIMSNTDPEAARQAAGVGVVAPPLVSILRPQ